MGSSDGSLTDGIGERDLAPLDLLEDTERCEDRPNLSFFWLFPGFEHDFSLVKSFLEPKQNNYEDATTNTSLLDFRIENIMKPQSVVKINLALPVRKWFCLGS